MEVKYGLWLHTFLFTLKSLSIVSSRSWSLDKRFMEYVETKKKDTPRPTPRSKKNPM